jgi:Nif-specific regulatory protein
MKTKIGSYHLIELASALSQKKNIDDIFKIVAQKTGETLKGDTVLIQMFNPKTHNTLKTIYKEGAVTTQSHYRYIQNQVSGWLLKHRTSFLSPDIKGDERFHKLCFDDTTICSVLGVPLQNEGAVIGTLIVFNSTCDIVFDENDLASLENIAVIAGPYVHNIDKLQAYFNTPPPESELLEMYRTFGLMGKCKKFIDLLHAIDAAAQCDVRVLLEGQSGTGKELVARAIHKVGERRHQPFVAIDCGAIPGNLVESELFGHVRGAFTGATGERKGMIEEANHGTLFMDEIINLPLDVQAKLMRVLQENEIRPVGSNKSRPVDVRIVAAASKSLSTAVEQGQFRADLYYRLYVYPIAIPSLTDRQEDISLLANYFLEKFAKQQRKQATFFDADMLEFMKARPWPGNIRELENFIERLVTLATSDMRTLDSSILPLSLKPEFDQLMRDDTLAIPRSLNDSIADYEARLIREALRASKGNQSKAARSLKLSVQALRYKMAKHGIE